MFLTINIGKLVSCGVYYTSFIDFLWFLKKYFHIKSNVVENLTIFLTKTSSINVSQEKYTNEKNKSLRTI